LDRLLYIVSAAAGLHAQDKVPAVAVRFGHHVAVYPVAFFSRLCGAHWTDKF